MRNLITHPTTDFPQPLRNLNSRQLHLGKTKPSKKRLRRSFPASKPTSGREVVVEVVATENTPPSTSKPKRKTFTCTPSSVFPIALAASRIETPNFKSSPSRLSSSTLQGFPLGNPLTLQQPQTQNSPKPV